MEALAYPHVSLLRLSELEAADPELVATRSTRSLIEYYFTITPCLLWHLLTRQEDIGMVTYLDADMMFFSSPEPLFAEAGDASVIITPHRFSRRLEELRKWGAYNVSWLTFRNIPEGLQCLSWYRKACLEWCYDVLEEARFADQKYLDAFPTKFKNVHIMAHLGGGCAPWNIEDYAIREQDGAVVVNGVTLIFYHAHRFRHIRGPFYASGLAEYTDKACPPAKKYILTVYVEEYNRAVLIARKFVSGRCFTDIRFHKRQTATFLRDCKKIIKEWQQGSLLIFYKASRPRWRLLPDTVE